MLAISAPAPSPSAAYRITFCIGRRSFTRRRAGRCADPPAVVLLLRRGRLQPTRGRLPFPVAEVVVELGLVSADGRLTGRRLAAGDVRRRQDQRPLEALEPGAD